MSVTKSNIIADKLEMLIMNSDSSTSNNPINDFENYSESNAKNYSNIVEQSVTSNGLTITINEVVFDYKNILITYTTSSNKFDTESIDIVPKVFINGEEVKIAGIGETYSNKDKNLRQITLEPRQSINEVGELDVKIVIGGSDGFFEQDKIIEDRIWEFNFKANKLDINKAIKKIDLNKKISLENGSNIYMEQIIITPISVVVELESENIQKYDLEKYMSVSCIIEEDNGNIIEKISEHGSEDSDFKGTYESRFKSISNNTNTIKITPIVLFNSSYDKEYEYNKELEKHSIELNIDR